jgi:hypothetical protein
VPGGSVEYEDTFAVFHSNAGLSLVSILHVKALRRILRQCLRRENYQQISWGKSQIVSRREQVPSEAINLKEQSGISTSRRTNSHLTSVRNGEIEATIILSCCTKGVLPCFESNDHIITRAASRARLCDAFPKCPPPCPLLNP